MPLPLLALIPAAGAAIREIIKIIKEIKKDNSTPHEDKEKIDVILKKCQETCQCEHDPYENEEW